MDYVNFISLKLVYIILSCLTSRITASSADSPIFIIPATQTNLALET